jgi:hypothetical protein
MKLIISLTVVFLAISVNTFSQKPPKGTQKIIVNSTLTKKDAIERVSRTLQRHNLQVAYRSEELFYLSTLKKRLPNTGASFCLDFEIADSSIAVSGKLMDAYMPNTLSKSIFWEIENKGTKGSAYKESFKIMYQIAQDLGPVSAFVQAPKKNAKSTALASGASF